jgi:hypothetical protein
MGSQHLTLATLPLVKTRYLLYRRLGGPRGRFGWHGKSCPKWDSTPGLFTTQHVSIPSMLPWTPENRHTTENIRSKWDKKNVGYYAPLMHSFHSMKKGTIRVAELIAGMGKTEYLQNFYQWKSLKAITLKKSNPTAWKTKNVKWSERALEQQNMRMLTEFK